MCWLDDSGKDSLSWHFNYYAHCGCTVARVQRNWGEVLIRLILPEIGYTDKSSDLSDGGCDVQYRTPSRERE